MCVSCHFCFFYYLHLKDSNFEGGNLPLFRNLYLEWIEEDGGNWGGSGY
jgi:hypothetical protein